MPPLRVVLLTETYLPEVGGGELQARMLSSALVRRGHEVTIITRRSRRNLPRREDVDGVTVLRLGPAGRGRWRKWGLLFTALWPMLRLRGRFDVALVSGFRILGIPAIVATRRTRTVCVLKADSVGEMTGEFYRAGLAKLRLTPSSLPVRAALGLRNRVLRRADAFIAISAEIEGELLGCGVPASRIFRVPNGVDTSRFRPASAGERLRLREQLELPSGPVITYTGRLVSYKGLPLLIAVWRDLVASGMDGTLVLVGPGGADMHSCEDELRRSVQESGLEDRVVFTGAVANVDEYLRASDAFVFPTENEAFGVALVEAMACGLPAIATPVGGIPDFLTDGVNGILVRPGDAGALRTALTRLIPDLAGTGRALGAAARRAVTDRFSEGVVAEGYLDVFHRIIRAPVRAGR